MPRQGAQGARLDNEPTAHVPGVVTVDGSGAAASGSSAALPGGLPDMIVTDITWTPATPVPSDQVVFSAVVQNIGTGPTPDGTIVDCLFTIQQSGVQVARTWEDDQTAAIAAGASVTMTANGSPTTGVNYWVATAGTFQIVALTNGNIRFSEIDLTNNTLTETIVVAAAGAGTPSAPVLHAVPGNGTVALSWNAPANNGSTITSYRLRRDGVILNPPDTTTSALVYTDNAVANNITYSYTVAAVNAVGEGAPSAPVLATPFTGTGIPTLLPNIAGTQPANCNLSWTTNITMDYGASDLAKFRDELGFCGYANHFDYVRAIPFSATPQTADSSRFDFWWSGTPSNVVDPLGQTTNGAYNYHQAHAGYGVPVVNGGTYGTKIGGTGDIGAMQFKKLHDPTFRVWFGYYFRDWPNLLAHLPPLGDYYNDTIWANIATYFSNQAAGIKWLGGDGIALDAEAPESFEPWPETALPPTLNAPLGFQYQVGAIVHRTTDNTYWRATAAGPPAVWVQTTLAAVCQKAYTRGYQIGQAIWGAFSACSVLTYSWQMPGGVRVSSDNTSPDNYPATGAAGGGILTNIYWGMMQAMAEAANPNSYWWNWDAEYYKKSYLGPLWASHTQRGQPGQLAYFSQNVPDVTRNHMMSRFGDIMAIEAVADGADPETPEPEYSQRLEQFRQRSMFGWRSTYDSRVAALGPNGIPMGTTGSPAQSRAYDNRTNPPGGHSPGLLAAYTNTTSIDSQPFVISAIAQSRAFNTVTLTFTAGQPFAGVRNVHWTLFAANGTTVTAQGEAVMIYNSNGTAAGGFNNAFQSCTCTIANASPGLYVTLDFYSCLAQRTSRRVALV